VEEEDDEEEEDADLRRLLLLRRRRRPLELSSLLELELLLLLLLVSSAVTGFRPAACEGCGVRGGARLGRERGLEGADVVSRAARCGGLTPDPGRTAYVCLIRIARPT
jgi:hypothetical protein